MYLLQDIELLVGVKENLYPNGKKSTRGKLVKVLGHKSKVLSAYIGFGVH
jgi:hypothetical protein